MSMLAERKRKTKWVLNPTKKPIWTTDSSGVKFGKELMEKMGWSAGKGLGAKEQGMQEPLKVSYKNDTKGMGFKGNDDDWIEHQDEFNALLNQLRNADDSSIVKLSETDKKEIKSLEEKSKQSKARVHYQKFTRGKDLSKYSENDLACILGFNKIKNKTKCDTEEVISTDEANKTKDFETSFGVTTINSGSLEDYFKRKWVSYNTTGQDNENLNNNNESPDSLLEEEQMGKKKKHKTSLSKEETETPERKKKHKSTKTKNSDLEDEPKSKKLKLNENCRIDCHEESNCLNGVIETEIENGDLVKKKKRKSKNEEPIEKSDSSETESKKEREFEKETLNVIDHSSVIHLVNEKESNHTGGKEPVLIDEEQLHKRKKEKKKKKEKSNENRYLHCVNDNESFLENNREKKKHTKDKKLEPTENSCDNIKEITEDINNSNLDESLIKKKRKKKISETELNPDSLEVSGNIEPEVSKRKKNNETDIENQVSDCINVDINLSESVSEKKLEKKKHKKDKNKLEENFCDNTEETLDDMKESSLREESYTKKKKMKISENENGLIYSDKTEVLNYPDQSSIEPEQKKQKKKKKEKKEKLAENGRTEVPDCMTEDLDEHSMEKKSKKRKKDKSRLEEKCDTTEEINTWENNLNEESNKKKRKKKILENCLNSEILEVQGDIETSTETGGSKKKKKKEMIIENEVENCTSVGVNLSESLTEKKLEKKKQKKDKNKFEQTGDSYDSLGIEKTVEDGKENNLEESHRKRKKEKNLENNPVSNNIEDNGNTETIIVPQLSKKKKKDEENITEKEQNFEEENEINKKKKKEKKSKHKTDDGKKDVSENTQVNLFHEESKKNKRKSSEKNQWNTTEESEEVKKAKLEKPTTEELNVLNSSPKTNFAAEQHHMISSKLEFNEKNQRKNGEVKETQKKEEKRKLKPAIELPEENGIDKHKEELLNEKKLDKYYPGPIKNERILRLTQWVNLSQFKGSNLEKLTGYGSFVATNKPS